MLLECQESYVINEGNSTKYFKIQKGARKGNPIYLQHMPIYFMSWNCIHSNQR